MSPRAYGGRERARLARSSAFLTAQILSDDRRILLCGIGADIRRVTSARSDLARRDQEPRRRMEPFIGWIPPSCRYSVQRQA